MNNHVETAQDILRGKIIMTGNPAVQSLAKEYLGLRAEIEKLPHGDYCPQNGIISCLRAEGDECEWDLSGCTKHPKEKFSCDCIKSKVAM